VASKIVEEHHEHLRRLFQRLQQFGVVINTIECVFKVSEILGHLISGKELAPLPQKVGTIINIPEPFQDAKGLDDFRYDQFLA